MTATTPDPRTLTQAVERTTIAGEMDAHALTSALWLALFCAQRADWPEALDLLCRLHVAALKREAGA